MLKKLMPLFIPFFIFIISCSSNRSDKPVIAPYFEAKGLDGRTYKLTDYRGKPLLLVFWATWCPTCHKELKNLAQHYQQLKKEGIDVLLVCESRDPKAIERTAEEYGFINMPIVIISDQMLMDYQWVRFLPTGILIDPQGYIVRKFTGELPVEKILKSAKR